LKKLSERLKKNIPEEKASVINLTSKLTCVKITSNLKLACNIKQEEQMAETGYCVKCKGKKAMKEEQKVTMKNGRAAMKGKCPECGTGMYKILGKAK
jgi:Domain of unknown function (DUF5679)